MRKCLDSIFPNQGLNSYLVLLLEPILEAPFFSPPESATSINRLGRGLIMLGYKSERYYSGIFGTVFYVYFVRLLAMTWGGNI